MIYIYVGLAGALGAMLRYWIGMLSFTGGLFPWATLFINFTGSFLLAWLTTSFFKKFSFSPVVASAVGTGFVGSFTTFSTFSVETVELFAGHHWVLGMIYVLLSLFGGLLMCRFGYHAGKEVKKAS